jgi:hypothetical protein
MQGKKMQALPSHDTFFQWHTTWSHFELIVGTQVTMNSPISYNKNNQSTFGLASRIALSLKVLNHSILVYLNSPLQIIGLAHKIIGLGHSLVDSMNIYELVH